MKEELLLTLLYRRAEGPGHPTYISPSAAEDSGSQLCYPSAGSQLPNEAGAPRAADDILLPRQLSFFCCWKLHTGIEPRSHVYSLGSDSPCPAPTTGLGHLAGCISPLLVSKSVLIDLCCGRMGGRGGNRRARRQ